VEGEVEVEVDDGEDDDSEADGEERTSKLMALVTPMESK